MLTMDTAMTSFLQSMILKHAMNLVGESLVDARFGSLMAG